MVLYTEVGLPSLNSQANGAKAAAADAACHASELQRPEATRLVVTAQHANFMGCDLIILQESSTARLLLLKQGCLVVLQDLCLHLLQQTGAAALVHVVGHPLLL